MANAFARTVATYQIPEVLLVCFSKDTTFGTETASEATTWLSVWYYIITYNDLSF